MIFDPPNTPEQDAICEFAFAKRDNLLISALAGAAKTTTLERVAHTIKGEPILAIAFNKRIAEALTKRLPGHCKAQTLNSLGHQAWARATGRRLTVNTKKTYEILKGIIDEKPKALRAEAYENFSFLQGAIREAKILGACPVEGSSPCLSMADFFETLEEDASDFERDIIVEALQISVRHSFAGTVDFDDQIYMPTVFSATFPQFPIVMVDEAQDFSSINHRMLEKVVSGRFFAVGDPFQSIYGFRGALHGSMSTLRQNYRMEDRPLSTSFRCPRAIIRAAHWRAPTMNWPEWAIEGEHHAPETFLVEKIPDGAAIICRNNAPLLSCAFRLLRFGRGIHLVGMDIGPNLIRILKRLGPESMTQTETLDAIEQWRTERSKRTRAPASLEDQTECLRVFAEHGTTLSAAIGYAEHIFKSSGPVQLLSGHKSKGLEWDYVYHLDPWRIPSKYARTEADFEQEQNVRYVIETRAKRALWKVNLEDLT